MRQTNLKAMAVDELVDRFAEIGAAQDDALWESKYAKFNRLFDRMNEVDLELGSRGTEARRALLRLYGHRNIQVRLKAAVRTLAVAPDVARQALQTIADSKFYPLAGDAGMLLSGLDDGSFRPD